MRGEKYFHAHQVAYLLKELLSRIGKMDISTDAYIEISKDINSLIHVLSKYENGFYEKLKECEDES